MLALIAGKGDLPERVVQARKGPVVICALEDQPPDRVTPDLTFRLETLGSLLLALGEKGVTEVCFAGGIDRPVIDPERLDAETAPLVPLLQEALAKGDDGALRVVIDLFERTGFEVRGAHEIAPDILAQSGVLTRREPRQSHHEDAERGDAALIEMSQADQGQACVIRKQDVLAREDVRGTDAMLREFALAWPDRPEAMFDGRHLTESARAWLADLGNGLGAARGLGAILYKGPKTDQDRRADLPTIGVETALLSAQAGFDGIVVRAGETLILDQERVIAVLDEMSMFLWVRP